MSSGLCVCLAISLFLYRQGTWNRNRANTLSSSNLSNRSRTPPQQQECLPSLTAFLWVKLYPGRNDNKKGDRISHDPFGHYQKNSPSYLRLLLISLWRRGWRTWDFPFSSGDTLTYLKYFLNDTPISAVYLDLPIYVNIHTHHSEQTFNEKSLRH